MTDFPWVPWRKGFNPVTGSSGHFRFDQALPGRVFLLEGVDLCMSFGSAVTASWGALILPGGSLTAPEFWTGPNGSPVFPAASQEYAEWRGEIPVSYLDGVYLQYSGASDTTWTAIYWGRVLPQFEAPV